MAGKGLGWPERGLSEPFTPQLRRSFLDQGIFACWDSKQLRNVVALILSWVTWLEVCQTGDRRKLDPHMHYELNAAKVK